MIGDNIKSLMKLNGYTQKQLAMRAGCTEAAISKYVNNEREPSITILKNLAIALGLSVDKLISGADVVEVVRCYECKHSYFVKSCSKYECRRGCGTLKYANDFCSYAERNKTDE